MQIKLIFIRKVLLETSLWKRGTRQFANGLLLLSCIKARLGGQPFIWKWVFIHMQIIKTNFHLKGCPPSLALIGRLKTMRKWLAQSRKSEDWDREWSHDLNNILNSSDQFEVRENPSKKKQVTFDSSTASKRLRKSRVFSLIGWSRCLTVFKQSSVETIPSCILLTTVYRPDSLFTDLLFCHKISGCASEPMRFFLTLTNELELSEKEKKQEQTKKVDLEVFLSCFSPLKNAVIRKNCQLKLHVSSTCKM